VGLEDIRVPLPDDRADLVEPAEQVVGAVIRESRTCNSHHVGNALTRPGDARRRNVEVIGVARPRCDDRVFVTELA
jgi:hypothetical protein